VLEKRHNERHSSLGLRAKKQKKLPLKLFRTGPPWRVSEHCCRLGRSGPCAAAWTWSAWLDHAAEAASAHVPHRQPPASLSRTIPADAVELAWLADDLRSGSQHHRLAPMPWLMAAPR